MYPRNIFEMVVCLVFLVYGMNNSCSHRDPAAVYVFGKNMLEIFNFVKKQ